MSSGINEANKYPITAPAPESQIPGKLARIEHTLDHPEKTCGEISCDECNERFGAAKLRIIDLEQKIACLKANAEAHKDAHANECRIHGFKIGELQAKWRDAAQIPTEINWREVESALIDAFASQGGTVWCGDGSGCAVQIVQTILSRQLATARADERERCAKIVETHGKWAMYDSREEVSLRTAAAAIRASEQ